MNRLALGVSLWLALGLELALRQTLGFGTAHGGGGGGSGGGGGPSPVFALVAVIACFAPAPLVGVLGFALLSGLALDLTTAFPVAGDGGVGERFGAVTVVGPHALGCVAGAWLVLRCRRVIVRQNPFAIATVAIVGAMACQATALVLLLLRDALDPQLAIPSQGLARLIGALYTALPAFVLALCAKWFLPVLGLPDPTDRRALYGRTPL